MEQKDSSVVKGRIAIALSILITIAMGIYFTMSVMQAKSKSIELMEKFRRTEKPNTLAKDNAGVFK